MQTSNARPCKESTATSPPSLREVAKIFDFWRREFNSPQSTCSADSPLKEGSKAASHTFSVIPSGAKRNRGIFASYLPPRGRC